MKRVGCPNNPLPPRGDVVLLLTKAMSSPQIDCNIRLTPQGQAGHRIREGGTAAQAKWYSLASGVKSKTASPGGAQERKGTTSVQCVFILGSRTRFTWGTKRWTLKGKTWVFISFSLSQPKISFQGRSMQEPLISVLMLIRTIRRKHQISPKHPTLLQAKPPCPLLLDDPSLGSRCPTGWKDTPSLIRPAGTRDWWMRKSLPICVSASSAWQNGWLIGCAPESSESIFPA